MGRLRTRVERLEQLEQALDPLPDQTGHSGEFLTTDGTDASWGTPPTNPGTVTSVAVTTGTSGVGVSGSPITGAGSIDLALGTAAAQPATAFDAAGAAAAAETAANAYTDAEIATLGSMAQVDDAPSDGSTYGRKDGAWEVVGSGGGSGLIYADFDATPGEVESAYSRPISVPYDWTITGWRVLGAEAETGNATFDVLLKTTIAGTASSIVGTTPPSVTGANAAEGSDMTGWTTTGNADELIVFQLTSPAAFHAVRVELLVTKA